MKKSIGDLMAALTAEGLAAAATLNGRNIREAAFEGKPLGPHEDDARMIASAASRLGAEDRDRYRKLALDGVVAAHVIETLAPQVALYELTTDTAARGRKGWEIASICLDLLADHFDALSAGGVPPVRGEATDGAVSAAEWEEATAQLRANATALRERAKSETAALCGVEAQIRLAGQDALTCLREERARVERTLGVDPCARQWIEILEQSQKLAPPSQGQPSSSDPTPPSSAS